MSHRRHAQLAVVALVLGGTVACAKTHARTVPPGQPLLVPAAPPKVLVVAEEPLPATSALDEPAPLAPIAPTQTPPPTPPRVRVEPRPAPAGDAAESKPPEPRTFGMPGDAGREKAVRERLATAARALARVDRARLSGAEQAEFDQARRFIQQAEQAVRERNLNFAATLADKAASLAADLVDR